LESNYEKLTENSKIYETQNEQLKKILDEKNKEANELKIKYDDAIREHIEQRKVNKANFFKLKIIIL
jgi:hypothetical protein